MAYGILFVVLAVAMVVGPIMMMKPSGRQLQLTRLRQQAMQLGLSASIQSLPKGLKSNRYPAQVAVYSRAFQGQKYLAEEALLLRLDFNHGLHYCANWDWQKGKSLDLPLDQKLRDALNTVSDSVIAIQINRLGVGVMWLEKSMQVTQVLALTELLHQCLLDSELLRQS